MGPRGSPIVLLGAVFFVVRFAFGVEEPLDREALLELGRADDSWNVPILERAFELRLDRLRYFPAPLYPPDLEQELVATLESLARLDPRSAGERARALLEVSPCDCTVSWEARKTLAKNGDLGLYRQALASFFQERDKWSDVLSRSSDPRLVDFRTHSLPEVDEHGSERRFTTELERNLARSREPEAIRALLLWASTATDTSSPRRVLQALPPGIPYEARVEAWLRRNPAPAAKEEPRSPPRIDDTEEPLRIQQRVLSLPPRDRYRAIRWLVERDHPALPGLPMSDEDIDRLYPYLVRSRQRAIRERAWRSRSARGRALASYLASPVCDEDERRETLSEMRDARADAIAVGGPKVFQAMEALLGAEEAASFVGEQRTDGAFLDALAVVPLPGARQKLETLGSPAAIERLMRREDRMASFPVLDRLRRGKDPETARTAALALVSLGAPGASATLRSEMARLATNVAAGPGLDPNLLAAALDAPIDPDLRDEVLFRGGADRRASPAALAALYRLQERSPESFLSLLSSGSRALVDRGYSVMSVSGNPRRLPLLVDAAVGAVEGSSDARRDAAFTGLAESTLGEFATRLHRLAGDPDRSVRFRAAAALVASAPTAESWTLRLLLGNLDSRSARERTIARAAIARLPRPVARFLLEELVRDGTAGSFGVLALLELSDPTEVRADRPLQERLWATLAEAAVAGDTVALLAASQLSLGEAVAAVSRRLTSVSSRAW